MSDEVERLLDAYTRHIDALTLAVKQNTEVTKALAEYIRTLNGRHTRLGSEMDDPPVAPTA